MCVTAHNRDLSEYVIPYISQNDLLITQDYSKVITNSTLEI